MYSATWSRRSTAQRAARSSGARGAALVVTDDRVAVAVDVDAVDHPPQRHPIGALAERERRQRALVVEAEPQLEPVRPPSAARRRLVVEVPAQVGLDRPQRPGAHDLGAAGAEARARRWPSSASNPSSIPCARASEPG